MLLSLLTFAAMMLFGGWIFGNIVPSNRKASNSSRPSTLTNRKLSLWSLLWLLFFPSFQQLSSPVPPQELN